MFNYNASAIGKKISLLFILCKSAYFQIIPLVSNCIEFYAPVKNFINQIFFTYINFTFLKFHLYWFFSVFQDITFIVFRTSSQLYWFNVYIFSKFQDYIAYIDVSYIRFPRLSKRIEIELSLKWIEYKYSFMQQFIKANQQIQVFLDNICNRQIEKSFFIMGMTFLGTGKFFGKLLMDVR